MGYQSKFKGSEIDEAIVEVKDHRQQILNIEERLNSGNVGGSGNVIEEGTYEQLKTLCNSGSLVPGKKYRMIDYETIISGDAYRSAGHVFDLILTAKSETAFYETCEAIQSTRDIEGYFDNCKLEKWQIQYTMDATTYSHVPVKGKYIIADALGSGDPAYYMWLYHSELPDGTHMWSGLLDVSQEIGYSIVLEVICAEESLSTVISANVCVPEMNMCDTATGDDAVGFVENMLSIIVGEGDNEVGGKGYIYRMTDEFNNSCPYDFKNVQYLVSLENATYGYRDETGLTNGWKYNYKGVDTASDQWVYTFNSQDYSHVYYDVSLNKAYDHQCKNNYIDDCITLPKNIILTHDEMVARGSDGYPEQERLMINNHFGPNCTGNIFNLCSDNTFENCIGNVGGGLYKNTLYNVANCVFTYDYNPWFYVTNSKFTECYNSEFNRTTNCEFYHMDDVKSGYGQSDSVIKYAKGKIPICTESTINNFTNVSGEIPSFIRSVVDLQNVTLQDSNKYGSVSFYDSNIKVNGGTWTLGSTAINNADVMMSGVDFSTIPDNFIFVSQYKTYVRANSNKEVFMYSELDLFNQAGTSYLVNALNTAI